jgi:hypothetical protein
MLTIKKPSGWQFVTSSSGGLGVEFVAAEFGSLQFNDPNKSPYWFFYGSAGLGLATGIKIPKIGKIPIKVGGKSVGGLAAPAFFKNVGQLYILDSFKGSELTEADIQGVCMFVEVGGGLLLGGAATAMLVGMSPAWLAASLAAAPTAALGGINALIDLYVLERLLETATGVLLMAGYNAGLQAGAGGAAFLGGLY